MRERKYNVRRDLDTKKNWKREKSENESMSSNHKAPIILVEQKLAAKTGINKK